MNIETAAELLYGWDKEKVKRVMKKNLLAEIDVPIHYAGEHWITVRCYGEREVGGKSFADFYCEVHDEPADWLPDSLVDQFASEILQGDHD